MAKMLKHLVFGLKKNPPAPPRPDYEAERLAELQRFEHPVEDPTLYGPDYENIPKCKSIERGQVQFAEMKPDLLVFDNYSEPADLRVEMPPSAPREEEDDPLYMSPLDDRGTAPPLEDEDMYCLPYDNEEEAPPLPQPCLLHQQGADESRTGDRIREEATYDVVPDVNSEDEEEDERGEGRAPPPPSSQQPEDEYDEPWEWTVGARLTSSLQVSPAQSLDEEDCSDPEEMSARQQRRLLYETAFDSRVKADTDDLDRLMQTSPLFRKTESVARAASRSSFGSTSGSSASSTPTHQPMEVVGRHSPRQHLTPTERRKVNLVRDGRSMSPRARNTDSGIRNQIVNQNFERRISFSNSSPWDSVSRCSGSSDKSSSQESMNVEHQPSKGIALGRSASRDSLFRPEDRRSQYPNNWKELANNKTDDAKKANLGVKVLPTDSPRSCKDPELKENNSPPVSMGRRSSRPSSLLSEVKPLDNVPQSPENDLRTSEDYDPPWDVKVKRPPTGSVSVPERLSSSGQPHPPLPTSITHDKLEAVEEGKATQLAKPNRPSTGPSSRPNLNLNLNSDSPRKARQNLTLNFGCSALSAVGEKVDPQLTLEKQGWYHGSISRVDAEGKLRVLKEGSYLVRNSESSKHDYSLSLKSARGFMHMKIVPTSEGRFILGQFSNPFSSIPEMIQHYSVNKLPIKGAEHMSLLYPVIDQLL